MIQHDSPLLIRHRDDTWHTPEVHPYKDEEALKLMLRDSPQLLPFYTPGSVFVDELTVPLIGSVDLAGVDLDGGITLVECKLGTNPEIRRSIIGQIFAYAAGLWQLTYEDFDDRFTARLSGVSLADAIKKGLPSDGSIEWDSERFRLNVAANLVAGQFTLIIAVDRITEELKRVVPYVNAHTVPGVRFIALEMGYVKDGDVEIVRPLTYGQESVAEKPTATRRSTWSTEAYLERLGEYGAEVEAVVRDLIAFSRERGAQIEGGTGKEPSVNVRFRFGGLLKTVWSSYLQGSGPSFDLNFEYLEGLVTPDILSKAAHEMRSIEGAATKYAALGPAFRARPSLAVDPIMLRPGAVATAKEAIDEILSGRDAQ